MLLDLLGGPDPLIANHFDNTARWFDRLIAAGKNCELQTRFCIHFLVSLLGALILPSTLILREETPSTGSVDISPLRADLLQEGCVPWSCAG